MSSRLCLNGIVRNERSNLVRMLRSVAPHISCYAITDTGSTDGTPDLIKEFFEERNIPGYIHHTVFKDFEQARNFALDAARNSTLEFDYMLLVDADMELVVEEQNWKDDLSAPAYDMVQRGGDMSYYNVRLARRDLPEIRYFGVTHEYLSSPGCVHLNNAWFIDHATGSNRVNKAQRDYDLLTEDVRQNPDNPRSWFYLAQTLKDMGRLPEAIEAYEKRIALGGWDEEIWYSQRSIAHCYRDLHQADKFTFHSLRAFNLRPTRAEPLYDLARYYRDKNNNNLACLFAYDGLSIIRPNDILFVDEYPYKAGFREELSIAGFYNPRYYHMGFALCNQLSLTFDAPDHTRNLARSNLFHYLPKLKELAKSFTPRQIGVPLPAGYVAMNPSIVVINDDYMMLNLRTVNYRITEQGQYDMQGDTAIRTRNYLCAVAEDLTVHTPVEILVPLNFPVKYDQVIGFEDVRLYTDGPGLWCSATVRQISEGGWCQQVRARIDTTPNLFIFQECNAISPEGHTEKNWMPIIGTKHRFMYGMNRTITADKFEIEHHEPAHFDTDHFRGGGQVIQFNEGYLAIIHEAGQRPHDQQRFYQHRFVWMTYDFVLERISKPFVFHEKQIEFAAGLCIHPETGQVIVTYGVRDREAWIASIESTDVWSMLNAG